MNDLRMGIYRHYKGPLYLVLGLAHDANEDGRKCVIYIPLKTTGAHTGPRMAVRDLSDFSARVCEQRGACVAEAHLAEDPGCEECLAHTKHVEHKDRFTWLGPELTESMVNADQSR